MQHKASLLVGSQYYARKNCNVSYFMFLYSPIWLDVCNITAKLV